MIHIAICEKVMSDHVGDSILDLARVDLVRSRESLRLNIQVDLACLRI